MTAPALRFHRGLGADLHQISGNRDAADGGAAMKALEMRRSVARLGLARVASALGASAAVRVAPLEYRTVDPPDLPGDGWHRVRTRCRASAGPTCR